MFSMVITFLLLASTLLLGLGRQSQPRLDLGIINNLGRLELLKSLTRNLVGAIRHEQDCELDVSNEVTYKRQFTQLRSESAQVEIILLRLTGCIRPQTNSDATDGGQNNPKSMTSKQSEDYRFCDKLQTQ